MNDFEHDTFAFESFKLDILEGFFWLNRKHTYCNKSKKKERSDLLVDPLAPKSLNLNKSISFPPPDAKMYTWPFNSKWPTDNTV